MDITPESILASIKEVFDEYKTSDAKKRLWDDMNKYVLAAWIALQTVGMTAQPAFADGDIVNPVT